MDTATPPTALAVARDVLRAESSAIGATADRLGAEFEAAVDLLDRASGSVIVTGLGKSGLIGSKFAATLASIGVPAHFVHAAEALHGDAGRLRVGDVLVGLSNSGTTAEVCAFAELARTRHCRVLAITGRGGSPLADLADVTLDGSVLREADPHDLAPTVSTAVALALGDALAVALMVRRQVTPDDFQRNHRGGALGHRLGERAAAEPSVRDVVVVGTAVVDVIGYSAARPRTGETVVGRHYEIAAGGKGLNQAVAAARAGARTAFVGAVGEDAFGGRLLQLLSDEGVATDAVTVLSDQSTGVGLPVVADDADNSIVVVPGASASLDEEHMRRARSAVGEGSVFVSQLELSSDIVGPLLAMASEQGATVILNPAPAGPIEVLLEYVDVLVPNQPESEALTGLRDPSMAALDLVRRKDGLRVVVTCGAAGAVLAEGDDVTVVPAPVVEAIDTVGAGDVFCGYLAAALSDGRDLYAAVAVAVAAASVSVTRAGAAISAPFPEELPLEGSVDPAVGAFGAQK